MTAETPGTPMTPIRARLAAIYSTVAYNRSAEADKTREVLLLAEQLADSLDRERRERVDPDLLARVLFNLEVVPKYPAQERGNYGKERAAAIVAEYERLAAAQASREHDPADCPAFDGCNDDAATPDHTEGEAIRREAEAIVEGIRGDVGVDTGELAEATRRFRERFDR